MAEDFTARFPKCNHLYVISKEHPPAGGASASRLSVADITTVQQSPAHSKSADYSKVRLPLVPPATRLGLGQGNICGRRLKKQNKTGVLCCHIVWIPGPPCKLDINANVSLPSNVNKHKQNTQTSVHTTDFFLKSKHTIFRWRPSKPPAKVKTITLTHFQRWFLEHKWNSLFSVEAQHQSVAGNLQRRGCTKMFRAKRRFRLQVSSSRRIVRRSQMSTNLSKTKQQVNKLKLISTSQEEGCANVRVFWHKSDKKTNVYDEDNSIAFTKSCENKRAQNSKNPQTMGFSCSFLQNVERLSENDYVPSLQDVLYIRKPTLGVMEHRFNVNGLSYRWTPRNANLRSIVFKCVGPQEPSEAMLIELIPKTDRCQNWGRISPRSNAQVWEANQWAEKTRVQNARQFKLQETKGRHLLFSDKLALFTVLWKSSWLTSWSSSMQSDRRRRPEKPTEEMDSLLRECHRSDLLRLS